MRTQGTDRILLRHYRVFPREPSIDVDEAGLVIRLPVVFGERVWLVPSAVDGVIDPEACGDGCPECARADELDELDEYEHEYVDEPSAPDWMTAEEFVVPYLATTSTWAASNLVLLFTVPQRIPPLRWTMAGQLGLSVRASRRDPGVRVDGVELRAVDPFAAAQTLIAHGATRVTDPDEFVEQHREVVRDPERIAGALAVERRINRWTLPLAVSLVAFRAWLILQDYRIVTVGILAGAAVSWLPRWFRRRA